MASKEFEKVLSKDALMAWTAIKTFIHGFLGKTRSPEYRSAVQTMMKYFEKLDVNMSLKIHLLHHHLEFMEAQSPTESDEHGERYHQIAMPFEMRYNYNSFFSWKYINFIEIRYRGKKKLDKVLGEICWWSKTLFEEKDKNEEEQVAEVAPGPSGIAGESKFEEADELDLAMQSDDCDEDYSDIDFPEDSPPAKKRPRL